MSDRIITYVYDGKEVYLSGRIATPQSDSKKKVVMVEILPIGAERGDASFARWVNMSDLLVVKDLENEDVENYETE